MRRADWPTLTPTTMMAVVVDVVDVVSMRRRHLRLPEGHPKDHPSRGSDIYSFAAKKKLKKKKPKKRKRK